MKKEHFHRHFAGHAQQNFSRRRRKFSPTAPSRLFCSDYASPPMRQKHCQNRLILSFPLSGTLIARLLKPAIVFPALTGAGFPQSRLFHCPENPIKPDHLTERRIKIAFLKKPLKLTDQSGSKYSAITAETLTSFNFESAGDNRQGQSDQKNSINNTGQIQRARIDHLYGNSCASDARFAELDQLTRRRILKESNICQQGGDHHQTKSNQSTGVSIPKINHILAVFLNLTAINKNNIQAIISPVKINRLNGDLIPKKLGPINAAPNHAAARLTEKSEITAAKNGLRFFRRLTVINLPYLCN